MSTDPGFDPKRAIEAGLRAVEQGRPREGVQIAEETLRRAGKYPGAYFLKAWALRAMGDTDGAIAFARKAEKAGGRDPLTLNLLALLYKEAGKYDLARRAWQDVLRKEPRALDAVLGIARLDRDLGRYDEAYAGFERALKMAPHHADTLASYADAKARGGAYAEAGGLAAHALDHAPDHPLALAVWAGEALKTETPDTVIARLETGLAAGKGNPALRAQAIGRLGEALEKAGRHDDAFARFSEANRLLYQSAIHAWGDSDYSLPHLISLLKALRDAQPATLTGIEEKAPPPPVFLVGFPRSGTTLAAQILAGHDKVVLSDERENAGAILEAAGRSAESWRDFLTMPPQRRTGLRRGYWKAARPEGPLKDGRILVDKLPANLAMIAALGAVFPDAKFIVMTRDPRDAVLSAFRQRFEPNPSTVQFMTIDTAAAYYDASHRLLDAAQRLLPGLDVRLQSYETLAGSPEAEGKAMAGFAGLDWQEGMLDVAARAETADIRTPSAPQLRETIEARSTGQWKLYAEQMQGAVKILTPWIERWGVSG